MTCCSYGIQDSKKSRRNPLFPDASQMVFSRNRTPVVARPYFVPMKIANCWAHLSSAALVNSSDRKYFFALMRSAFYRGVYLNMSWTFSGANKPMRNHKNKTRTVLGTRDFPRFAESSRKCESSNGSLNHWEKSQVVFLAFDKVLSIICTCAWADYFLHLVLARGQFRSQSLRSPWPAVGKRRALGATILK